MVYRPPRVATAPAPERERSGSLHFPAPQQRRRLVMLTSLRRFVARTSKRAARPGKRPARLVLELLEDRTLPTTAPVLPGTLFAAQTYDGNNAVAGSPSVPPDPSGAAGPAYLVSVVNSSLQVRAKATGALVRNLGLNAFFQADAPDGLFDPKVVYDQYAGKFVVVAMELSGADDPDAGS